MISERARAIPSSPTSRMRNRAKGLGDSGHAVANLASGEVAHPPPPAALAAARRALADPATHLYGPTAGLPALREAITCRAGGGEVEVDPGQVVVTCGAKQALHYTFLALLDPGDEVLVPVPAWSTYGEGVRLAGGSPVPVPTVAEEAFTVSPARLEERLTPATRAVLLGSPANPTGTVYGAAELAALAAWTAARGLWLVVDEVYDELLPGRRPAGGALAVAAGRGDRCVVVDSVAKRWAMPGWRVGWVIAPAEVAAAVARIQSHTSSHAPNVCQAAAAAAIEAGAETVASVHRLTRRGRAITLRRLEEIGLPVVPPAGAFYAFVDVRGLGAGDGGGAEAPASEAIAERLLLGHGVAVVPGEAFGAPGWLRVSFGRPADELERGLDGLAECVAACGPQTVAQ